MIKLNLDSGQIIFVNPAYIIQAENTDGNLTRVYISQLHSIKEILVTESAGEINSRMRRT